LIFISSYLSIQSIVDLSEYKKLSDGKTHQLKLPLKAPTTQIYDAKGNKLTCSTDIQPQGEIEFDLTIPSIYDNMCGTFWNIVEGYFDVDGNKMWVVMEGDLMSCWDTPFQNELFFTVDSKTVANLEEAVYDKLACKSVMHGVAISRTNLSSLYWAWGDDSSSIRGLWRRAFKRHHKHHQ